MIKYPTALLKNITTKIGSGATPRGGEASYKNSGISLIRSMNVYDLSFHYDHLAYIDQDQADQLSNVIVEESDILLNITGASVARCCMVPEGILPARVNQHVAIIRVDPELADPRFVMYYLVSNIGKARLLNTAQGGATREALTKSDIENFEVPLPLIDIQKTIGISLERFDQLIRINERKIKILEEMARRIYHEWFVDFKFPGHEKVKMVESGHPDFGMVPEAWRVGKLSDILELKSGFAFKSKSFVENGEWPLVTITNVHAERFEPKCTSRLDSVPDNVKPYCYLSSGDVLMSLTGNVGRVCRVYGGKYLLNQRVAKILSKTLSGNFALPYCALNSSSIQDRMQRLAKGVAQPNLSPVETISIDYLIPEVMLISQFENLVEPMLEASLICREENLRLAIMRDVLLPKLISGEIDVSNIDIDGIVDEVSKVTSKSTKEDARQVQTRSNH